MPPHKPGIDRACNTPENAMAAVTSSRNCLPLLQPGRAWLHQAPRGEYEIQGCLLLNGEPVAVLRFNPEDGNLLPKGLHALRPGQPNMVSVVESKLSKIAGELKALDGAEFREPEACWAVPLAHVGRIVGHMKVSADGASMLPDRKASEEMAKLK